MEIVLVSVPSHLYSLVTQDNYNFFLKHNISPKLRHISLRYAFELPLNQIKYVYTIASDASWVIYIFPPQDIDKVFFSRITIFIVG